MCALSTCTPIVVVAGLILPLPPANCCNVACCAVECVCVGEFGLGVC